MLGDDGNQIGTHSALSIPHLNGSFPEFILGWTIGANQICVLRPPSPFILSPQERKWLLDVSGLANGCPANPVARIFRKAANDSPSPWGEGRDE